jgi:hypothetical protein
MLTRRELLFGLSLAPALTASGAEVWDTKPPAEWGEKDIQKLMSKSPWGKEASTEFSGRGRGGGEGRGFGGPGGGPPGGGPPGGGPPDGGGRGPGGPGGRGGGGTVVVRWETAAPIRAVSKIKLPGNAASSYVISISNFAMLSQLGDSLGSASGMEAMKKGSYLQVLGKEQINPTIITTLFDQAGVLLFYFPNSTPFTVDDKQILFNGLVSPMVVQARFTPKEMMYKGALAL